MIKSERRKELYFCPLPYFIDIVEATYSKSCSKRERKEARQRGSLLPDPDPLDQALAKELAVSKTRCYDPVTSTDIRLFLSGFYYLLFDFVFLLYIKMNNLDLLSYKSFIKYYYLELSDYVL